jgi:hypothetical protein
MPSRTIVRRFFALAVAVSLGLGVSVAALADDDHADSRSDDAPAARPEAVPPAHANDGEAPPAHANDDGNAPPAHAKDDGDAPPAHANDEASNKENAGSEGGRSDQREIKGIPDENPNFDLDRGSAADADDCERGDTDIKTAPGGVRVNVPCHPAEHQGLALGHEDPPGRSAAARN